jgi:hypothetical protein
VIIYELHADTYGALSEVVHVLLDRQLNCWVSGGSAAGCDPDRIILGQIVFQAFKSEKIVV